MIGDMIKEYRLKKGLKQSELAQKANISREAVGNYERGDRIPNIEIVRKIANALDIPLNKLLEGSWEDYTEEIKEDLSNFGDSILRKNLLERFNMLNSIGKREALKRISELSIIPEYIEKDK